MVAGLMNRLTFLRFNQLLDTYILISLSNPVIIPPHWPHQQYCGTALSIMVTLLSPSSPVSIPFSDGMGGSVSLDAVGAEEVPGGPPGLC